MKVYSFNPASSPFNKQKQPGKVLTQNLVLILQIGVSLNSQVNVIKANAQKFLNNAPLS